MSGRDTEWRDLAAADAKAENPHHENCDTRDTMIPGKPCNCYLHWREKYGEAAAANLELHKHVADWRERAASLIEAMRRICNADTLDAAQHIAGGFVLCEHGHPMTEDCPSCRREDVAWAELLHRALQEREDQG